MRIICVADNGLSEDLLDLLCKSRKQNTEIEGTFNLKLFKVCETITFYE